ncbi:neuralized-like protein 4 isoform X2 [Belonocnema kinseyi]|nr:neuralized-like protein 4 isoform X2 [Belonocnema kinseyi]
MELAFPCIMHSRSDTWIMTGHGVMHNGIAFIYHYGQNLDKLQVGDRVGVMKNDSSILHFYINGEDQGDVTTITEGVYGFINLHGQAVQATIVDANFQKTLRFHHLHGKDARITNNGLTATRRRPLEIFYDSVEENQNLSDGGRFQISIDKMDSEQKGSIIQKYSKPENVANQQSTSVIERWNQTTVMQKNLILKSITPIINDTESLKNLVALPMKSKYALMDDTFWDSKFHNHRRNIKLLQTNSLRFDCYKIEIKPQGNDEELSGENFKELGNEETIESEFKAHMVTDLDDSCLINGICFIHECCQCTIL